MVALLVDVLLQLLREVAEHVGDGLRDLALVVGVEQRRDELLEATVEEDGRAADAEELRDGRVDVDAGAVEGLFLLESGHLAVAADADSRVLLGALGDVRQDDDAARRRRCDLPVLVDFAGDAQVFLVVRDFVELMVDERARVAAEDHVAAILLLPDGAGVPEAVLVDGLEDQRVLVRLRTAEEIPVVRRRAQLIDRDELLVMCGQQRVDAVGLLRVLRRDGCGRFGHQLLERGDALRRHRARG